MAVLTLAARTMSELTSGILATHYPLVTMDILTTQHGSGEEEWEQHLSAALGNHSVRWLHLEG